MFTMEMQCKYRYGNLGNSCCFLLSLLFFPRSSVPNSLLIVRFQPLSTRYCPKSPYLVMLLVVPVMAPVRIIYYTRRLC